MASDQHRSGWPLTNEPPCQVQLLVSCPQVGQVVSTFHVRASRNEMFASALDWGSSPHGRPKDQSAQSGSAWMWRHIRSQVFPKSFEVPSMVCRLGAAYMLMHLAGCLRFWYLEVWCEYSMPSMPSMIWYFIFPASAESFGSF